MTSNKGYSWFTIVITMTITGLLALFATNSYGIQLTGFGGTSGRAEAQEKPVNSFGKVILYHLIQR